VEKDEASDFLKTILEDYKDTPFSELTPEVGIGDHYEAVSKDTNGKSRSYSVAIDIEWENDGRTGLVISAAIYGDDSVRKGFEKEIQRKSIIIMKNQTLP